MSNEVIKPIYDWCNNCKGPITQPRDTICLACIRMTLRKQDIEVSLPDNFIDINEV